jgi:hypothetical protein
MTTGGDAVSQFQAPVELALRVSPYPLTCRNHAIRDRRRTDFFGILPMARTYPKRRKASALGRSAHRNALWSELMCVQQRQSAGGNGAANHGRLNSATPPGSWSAFASDVSPSPSSSQLLAPAASRAFAGANSNQARWPGSCRQGSDPRAREKPAGGRPLQ